MGESLSTVIKLKTCLGLVPILSYYHFQPTPLLHQLEAAAKIVDRIIVKQIKEVSAGTRGALDFHYGSREARSTIDAYGLSWIGLRCY